MPNEHDMLTGSDSDGRALPGGLGHDLQQLDVGRHRSPRHARPFGSQRRRQRVGNSAHMSRDCTKAGLIATGGAGHFYCFAIN